MKVDVDLGNANRVRNSVEVKNQARSGVDKRKQGGRKSSINVLTIKKEEIISLAGGQPLAF